MSPQNNILGRRQVLKAALLTSLISLTRSASLPADSGEANENRMPSSLPTTTGALFPFPDRIRYDGQCLTIDNRDILLFSGSFHYFRCPKPLWRPRLDKMVRAGLNCLETYVAWNVHEPAMPSSPADYSKINLKDLDEFLSLVCDEYGLFVTIRPGPYICAEWDTGGFPQWLLTKRPAGHIGPWLRTDDPVFVQWSEHWYNAVCPVIREHQITAKSPGKAGVVLFQIENEYNGIALPLGTKRRYFESLIKAAQSNGINIPLFGNWSSCILGAHNPALREVFDSNDFYPRHNIPPLANSIRQLAASQPNAPRMIAEMQGGWFTASDAAPSLVPQRDGYAAGVGPLQTKNLTLYMLAHGETVLNYYMFFGGTNLGDRAASGIATSYDYSASIRECGGVGEKYRKVAGIGAMLKQHGSRLCRSKRVAIKSETGSKDVTVVLRRSGNGDDYYFIRNQANAPRHGVVRIRHVGSDEQDSITYHLGAFDASVFFVPNGRNTSQGQWLLKPRMAALRPLDTPAPVPISTLECCAYPGPNRWRTIVPGLSMAQLGIYDCRPVYYRQSVSLTETDLARWPLALQLEVFNGSCVTYINGEALQVDANARGTVCVPLKRQLRAGENTIEVVCQADGHPNGHIEMENSYGVAQIRLTKASGGEYRIENWRLKNVQGFEHAASLPEIKSPFPTSSWKPLPASAMRAAQLAPWRSGVFRTRFNFSPANATANQTVLGFEKVCGEGDVFLNGTYLGRTDSSLKSYSFHAAGRLVIGANELVVVVRNRNGRGGLGRVSLSAPVVPVGDYGTGLHIGEFPVDYDIAQLGPGSMMPGRWQSGSLSVQHGGSDGADRLMWYRLKFSLPHAEHGSWVPWCLDIDAVGRGFIYLNGNNIGWHWQQRGQRYFYLPECWLKFGKGVQNEITMLLRPQERMYTAIISASVMPYKAFAELSGNGR